MKKTTKKPVPQYDPGRAFRCPDALWIPFVADCEAVGLTSSDGLRLLVEAQQAGVVRLPKRGAATAGK